MRNRIEKLSVFMLIKFLEFNSILCSSEKINCLKYTKTCFIPISQGTRLYAQYHTPKNNLDCNLKIDFEAMYFLQESMNSCEIAKSLFEYNPLLFSGNSDFNDEFRPKNAMVPEYFGLGNDTDTKLMLFPSIKNQTLEFQLNASKKNFWFQVNIPVVWANWKINNGIIPDNKVGGNDLDIDNNDDPAIIKRVDLINPYQTGSTDEDGNITYTNNTDIQFINDYFYNNLNVNQEFSSDQNSIGVSYWKVASYTDTNDDPVTLSNELNQVVNSDDSLLNVYQDAVYPSDSLVEALNGYKFGDLTQRSFNLFNFGNNSYNNYIQVADIQLWFGYDFLHLDKMDAGFYIRATIPTGTNINSIWNNYLFSPVIGNGRHLAIGAGLNGQFYFLKNECSSLEIHMDGYFMHLFGSDQFRTFDLTNQPMSRYAIVKELKYKNIPFDSNSNNNSFLYQGLYPLGDINSKNINITIDLMGEALIDLIYKKNNFSSGLGYSFTGQTKEKSCDECDLKNIDNNILPGRIYYGYKGANELSEITLLSSDNSIFSSSIPLTPTNSSFYVKNNENVTLGGNSGVYFYGEGTNGEVSQNDVFSLPQINRSGLMEAQILNRIFAHIEYSWKDCLYNPILRILGAYGFVPNSYLTAQYWDFGVQFSCSF